MADTKRASVSERVATPRATSQSSTDHLKTLGNAIGARIRITTSSPTQTLEGTLFTACPTFNVVAINTSPEPSNPNTGSLSQPGDYHVIPISRIQNLQVLSLPANGVSKDGFGSALPPVQPVDTAKLQERLERMVAEAKKEESKKGKGVSAEAQALFNALDKMYSTRWYESDIIVDDAVRIAPPYTPDTCKAPKGKEQSLTHIRKIVEGEKRKFADRSRGTSPMPKKGG